MIQIVDISPQGEVALIDEEGEVLTAYICPAGVWTIGVGLTAGSGVVSPKRGMTITREESRRLLRLAIARNYSPRVRRAGMSTSQHEHDGSVMFDFNTGRIHNASWVGHYLKKAYQAAETSFKSWNKGGGRVLAGLVKRRDHEWDIIRHARYPRSGTAVPPKAVDRTDAIMQYQAQLIKLGYDLGPTQADGKHGALTDKAVRAFQQKHDLEVDGIVGPATRAALVRAIEAKAQNRNSGAAAGGGAGAGGVGESAATGEMTLETLYWVVGLGATAFVIVLGAYLIWRYRGRVFAPLPDSVKDWSEDNLGIVIGRRVSA